MEQSNKGAVRKLNIEAISYLNLFENLTRTKAKDCVIEDDGLLFIIEPEYMGRVLGAKGSNLRKIEERFKKKVRIIEFSQDVVKFIRNIIYPVRPDDIRISNDKVEILASDHKTKGMLIGRDRKNLKRLQKLVARYFNYVIEVM